MNSDLHTAPGTATPDLQAIDIRHVTTIPGFQRCVDIQLAVWGYSDGDVIPRRMFLVAQRIGGQVIGAFRGDIMIGFAMALPGIRDGHCYLHSHMLAVLPEFRDSGIGRRLKLAQRDDAIARGIQLMEWTFDPLEIKNAHLNIERLGAIVRRYQPDFYGPSSSPLQGSLPTDRLYAEWWMESPRVIGILQQDPPQQTIEQRLLVPHEIYQWRRDPAMYDQALSLQARNRHALEAAFSRGLATIGYERDGAGNGYYLLGRLHPEPGFSETKFNRETPERPLHTNPITEPSS